MEFNFLIGKIMGNNTMGKAVKEGLGAVAAAAVLSVSPASAEATAQHKINKVTCTTKASCEQLSLSIQAQIDELEKKGLENLTEEEFNKYDKLSDNLIAVENNKQAQENQKQVKQKELIATKDVEINKENQKQAQENQKQVIQKEIIAKQNSDIKSAYAEVNSNLLSIKGSL